MLAGEFFINLGIKGADKTLGELTNTQKGMEGLGASSLEAKAAVVALFYAMKQLVGLSANTGFSLHSFEAFTGIDHKVLERYQYAARKVGDTNESVTSSV